ncbi:MAG TPA: hypothetical protein VM802_13315, partial [Chitinophaga sp.]|uniref:hypothetical protein n=1 Tax=Chitinophaga sp. TaxID=1869181 RepID=UPI002CC4D6D4
SSLLMKKAKIALAAMIVLVATAGALAFKANRYPHVFYMTNTRNWHCSLATAVLFETTGPRVPNAFTVRLSTAPTTAPCPTIYIIKTV